MTKTFTDDGSFYTIDGKQYVSIGTIISYNPEKQAKLDTFWRQPLIEKLGLEEATKQLKEQLDYAAWRGTATHDLIERYLLDGREPTEFTDTPQQLFSIMKPALDKINTKVPQFQYEAVVASPTLGVAGRLDCLAKYDGKLSIIDFKTSKGLKAKPDREDWFLQAAFYALANMDTNGDYVENLVIINGGEDGKLRIYEASLYDYLDKLDAAITRYKEQHGELF